MGLVLRKWGFRGRVEELGDVNQRIDELMFLSEYCSLHDLT